MSSWLRTETPPRRSNGRADIETTANNDGVVRILLAEDNDDLRMVMPALIDSIDGLRCAATTAYLEEVGPLIARYQVAVAVLDIELRGGSALKRLPELRREHPATRFVIHSGHSNPELVRQAESAGASAYVLKSGDFDDLIAAIRRLAA